MTVSFQHVCDLVLMRHFKPLQWLYNERDGVSNHRRLICLLNRLFRCASKETSKKKNASRHWPFVRGIHLWPVDSTHKGPVTRKMFPFDDVIMTHESCAQRHRFVFWWNYTQCIFSTKKWQFVIWLHTVRTRVRWQPLSILANKFTKL